MKQSNACAVKDDSDLASIWVQNGRHTRALFYTNTPYSPGPKLYPAGSSPPPCSLLHHQSFYWHNHFHGVPVINLLLHGTSATVHTAFLCAAPAGIGGGTAGPGRGVCVRGRGGLPYLWPDKWLAVGWGRCRKGPWGPVAYWDGGVRWTHANYGPLCCWALWLTLVSPPPHGLIINTSQTLTHRGGAVSQLRAAATPISPTLLKDVSKKPMCVHIRAHVFVYMITMSL